MSDKCDGENHSNEYWDNGVIIRHCGCPNFVPEKRRAANVTHEDGSSSSVIPRRVRRKPRNTEDDGPRMGMGGYVY